MCDVLAVVWAHPLGADVVSHRGVIYLAYLHCTVLLHLRQKHNTNCPLQYYDGTPFKHFERWNYWLIIISKNEMYTACVHQNQLSNVYKRTTHWTRSPLTSPKTKGMSKFRYTWPSLIAVRGAGPHLIIPAIENTIIVCNVSYMTSFCYFVIGMQWFSPSLASCGVASWACQPS